MKEVWTIKARLAALATTTASVVVMASMGHYVIKTLAEGGCSSPVDSIYWAIATLTTLGAYPSEVMLTSVYGKIFTIFVVLSGVMIIFIGVPFTVEPWLEKTIARMYRRRFARIPQRDHVIICGYNEVAKHAMSEIKARGVDVVILTKDAKEAKELEEEHMPHIFSREYTDSVFIRAGIGGARAIILAEDDATNAFGAITARRLREDINIVALARDENHARILRMAGANNVVSPLPHLTRMVAKKAKNPQEIGLIAEGEIKGLEIHQLKISESSAVANKTLAESEIGKKTGCIAVAIWREGRIIVNPSGDETLKPGDILVFMGTKERVKSAIRFIGGEG